MIAEPQVDPHRIEMTMRDAYERCAAAWGPRAKCISYVGRMHLVEAGHECEVGLGGCGLNSVILGWGKTWGDALRMAGVL